MLLTILGLNYHNPYNHLCIHSQFAPHFNNSFRRIKTLNKLFTTSIPKPMQPTWNKEKYKIMLMLLLSIGGHKPLVKPQCSLHSYYISHIVFLWKSSTHVPSSVLSADNIASHFIGKTEAIRGECPYASTTMSTHLPTSTSTNSAFLSV